MGTGIEDMKGEQEELFGSIVADDTAVMLLTFISACVLGLTEGIDRP